MTRRTFITGLAVGLGALYLALRPETVTTLPKFKGFRWECRGWNSANYMVYEAPTNPPEIPEILDAARCGWRTVVMATIWN